MAFWSVVNLFREAHMIKMFVCWQWRKKHARIDAHQSLPFPDKPVEQSGFADVRSSDYGDLRSLSS